MLPLRYIFFTLVGAFAAATHFCVAVALVAFLGLKPLLANVCGYLAALFVSYQGQSRLTFSNAPKSGHRWLKFTLTSLSAFALNTASYAALLRWTALDYRVALALVLVGVACFTYLTLKLWVFTAAPGHS